MIEIITADITKLEVDAIVNAANRAEKLLKLRKTSDGKQHVR